MGVRSQGFHKRLVAELEGLGELDFQKRCKDILSSIWPGIRGTPKRKDLDNAGIDLYVPDDSGNFQVIIQCKGFEVLEFAASQLRQCTESIEKFRKSKFSTAFYFLVLNRRIEDGEVHLLLESQIKTLEGPKCKNAKVFDVKAFVTFVFQKRIETLLVNTLPKSNSQFLSEYERVMGIENTYVEEVPFAMSTGHEGNEKSLLELRKGSNPIEYIVKNIRKERSSVRGKPISHEPIKRVLTVLLSEFGFGKTSLLLHLARRLKEEGHPTFYVPAVLLSPHVFSNQTEFLKDLYSLLDRDEGTHVHDDISPFAFRHILRTRADFVLLLDGIDEHRQAYGATGLAQVFNCLQDLSCKICIAIRKEFWEERSGSIRLGLAKGVRKLSYMILTDWRREEILRYLDQWERSPRPPSKGLKSFRQLVLTDQYEQFYGDIPRRPLFLEMLVLDLENGATGKRLLPELYQQFVIQKMRRGIQTPYAGGDATGRPLPIEDIDLTDLESRLLVLLERIAYKATQIVEEIPQTQILEVFSDGLVMEEAKKLDFPNRTLAPYLMHTVLVTSGVRSHQGVSVRFAHRSLHEYFLARAILKNDESKLNTVDDAALREKYPEGVVRFILDLINLNSA